MLGKYPRPQTAEGALERLLRGNHNFVQGHRLHPHQTPRRRQHVAQEGQHPFALIVACSDSREAPELLFDCGLGDLFVVRTAGQIVGYTALGSIEFGVLHLGIQLVLVLGHSGCGAVKAALQVSEDSTQPGGHLRGLIDAIVPCVELAREMGADEPAEATLRLHVAQTVETIRRAEVLQGLSGLQVRGGRYDIASGEVTLLDEA